MSARAVSGRCLWFDSAVPRQFWRGAKFKRMGPAPSIRASYCVLAAYVQLSQGLFWVDLMPIKTQCPSCKKNLSVSDEHAEKKIRCHGCSQAVQLPGSKPASRQSSTGDEERRRPPKRRPKRRPQNSGGRRRKRRPREEDSYLADDLWSSPIGSHGDAVEEDDYEEFGIEPRRRGRGDDDDYGPPRRRGRGGTRRRETPDSGGPIYPITFGICGFGGSGLNEVQRSPGGGNDLFAAINEERPSRRGFMRPCRHAGPHAETGNWSPPLADYETLITPERWSPRSARLAC